MVDDLTPNEFLAICKAKKKLIENRIKDQYDLGIINAYYNAGFQRQKKLGKINKYFAKRDKQTQTQDQMLEKVKALHAYYTKK